ncbi:hypothetical protein [Saccharothrix variisporea]|uniref:PH (Pleckstrin Homology) domain-containing protein n=1 Tax=Saccharothrix variisporea TaxID=543527 RepID=A0A495X2A1_9PSEU|nr:hypothetical protein [Saccharothrix variisporea]RKT67669.1 hypothetical protein DFJ66_0845 [Saccharothrix variisporea]
MTVGDPYRREYRNSGGEWLWVGVAAPLVGGAALVVRLVLDDEVPGAVPFAVGTALALLVVLVVRLAVATATISDQSGLTIRGAFRRHTTAWSAVQGIEIEVNPGAGARGAPNRIVVLYDATGRRRFLPHLNDRSTADLDGEVAALREVWALCRGEDWVPVPVAVEKIARTRRYPTPLVHIAVKAMLGSLIVGHRGQPRRPDHGGVWPPWCGSRRAAPAGVDRGAAVRGVRRHLRGRGSVAVEPSWPCLSCEGVGGVGSRRRPPRVSAR